MVPRMDENELARQQDEGVEGGALDDPGEGGRRAGEPQQEPVESGGLEEAQQGKGYGEDEGERAQAIDDG